MTPILAFALAACGALPNPKPTNQPATWQPPPRPPAAATATAATASSDEAKAPAKNAPAAPAPTSPAQSGAIAIVGGKPIDISELLGQWMHNDSFAVIDQVNHLVVNHIVDREAERLGLNLDPELLDKAYQASIAAFEKELAAKFEKDKKPAVKLDDYVGRYLGLDPFSFRKRLRAESDRTLDAERVIRAHLLQNEHALARLIAVKTEEDLKLVQADLAAGKSFEQVASARSVHPSSKEGGRIAPILRANTPMAHLAFSVKEGEITAPQYEQNAWLLLKVEARPKPLEGSWKEIGPAVEKSLSERGIEDLEFPQWKEAMKARYPIDLSPLMRAAGEPVH
jgi:parvulin-like peptidyl-prolyl isomerase